jgi:NAD(P)-dependent dehydrogenase (short-subunit alcohol dehydrogenase family)
MNFETQPPRSLEGKVLLVTGAGRGIGRDIALLAASEGAKVVVNDLGAGPDGEGNGDTGPASSVVEEIKAAGGEAVANCDSVANPVSARHIVASAMDSFGRIDCIVNNAGILRDKIFHRMSQEDWELVINVHLMGTFNVSNAAAQHFRQQGSGSFVNMTSTGGLIGNMAQANYSAAKMGIVGLSRSIALDMAKFGVRSNCIAPYAWTRLIGAIPTETDADKARVARIKAMGSEKIAPLAIFLASDLAKDVTGQIFAVRKNEIYLMSQPRPIRSVHRSEGWTPRTLSEHMLPAIRQSLVPLEIASAVFSWDPI